VIPYGRQLISDDDVRAVVEVLRSDFLTQGPQVPRFEQALAGYCGAAHAVAVNSATSALHIACLALGVGSGDRVWTSPNTFVASANCARYCGAAVDFVDIDERTLNMSVAALAEKLADAEKTGTLPKVVIPVHFSGLPCDLAGIATLARRYGFHVIEDASHAVGARFGDSIVGDCRYSDIAVFSFHPVKIITTAEGGLATTKSAELAQRMQMLRSHGITRSAAQLQRPDEGAWYYEQHCLGYNYRMTELQAALGLSQLTRLDEWIARRHALADFYDTELARLPLILPVRPAGSRSALHLYVVQVDSARSQLSRRTVFDRLRAAGIGVNVHYIPIHFQPYYRKLGFTPGMFPASERYYARALSVPLFPALTVEQQNRVNEVLHATLGRT
jgi:UDP-4-amino-4,6-dideoxy-N-acetyl-beta-L-altrosamine transaminase